MPPPNPHAPSAGEDVPSQAALCQGSKSGKQAYKVRYKALKIGVRLEDGPLVLRIQYMVLFM